MAAGIALGLPGAAWAGPARVALLPVVVHTNEPDSEYLSGGLGDMLAARLEQGGGIQVLRLESSARATTKQEVALETGAEAGADYVVYGSFTQFGEGASLDLRCSPVGDPKIAERVERQVFVQAGTLGEIIPKLDELTGKITRYVRTGVGESSPAAAEEPKPASNGEPDADALAELRSRVEALERAVYVGGEKAPEAGTP